MDNTDQCKTPECDELVYSRSRARGFCYTHYWRDYHARNRDKRIAEQKAWRDANPDYWKNKDPESKRAADKRYSDKNRAERNENERLRRILKADAIQAQRRSPLGIEAARRATRARRAREKGVEHEAFSDAEMLEVYGTDCYLCLEPIDLDAPRHPNQGTNWHKGLNREHVIPIARGGADTLENCRPSHAECNFKKGAK